MQSTIWNIYARAFLRKYDTVTRHGVNENDCAVSPVIPQHKPQTSTLCAVVEFCNHAGTRLLVASGVGGREERAAAALLCQGCDCSGGNNTFLLHFKK